MHLRNKLQLKKNSGTSLIPRDYMLLRETKQFQLTHHIQTQSHIKRNSLISLKLNTKFLTRIINQQYKMNCQKTEMFSQSILFYTKIIIDPNTQDKQFKRLMYFINDKYQFIDSAQSLGLLVGNMMLIRLENPQMRREISNSIEKLYMFSGKDRTFCDFSKIIYFSIIDMLMEFSQSYPSAISYIGWRHFERVQALFEDFYVSKERSFKQVWTEFKLNEEKHEHEVAMLIYKLTKIDTKDEKEKNIQLFSFIFLLKFLLSQNKFTDHKLSQILVKSIKSIIVKLCYVQINTNFYHMNWFLILCKFVIREKEFFGEIRMKMYLGLKVAQLFFQSNRTKYANNLAQEFTDMTTKEQIFFDFQKIDSKDSFSQIASLKLHTQNVSQLLSYGSKFNQRRKASYESISRYLSQKSHKSYIPEHKLNLAMMTHRSQILKYTEEKLQKQEFLSLLLSLEEIYKMFEAKMEELTGAIADDMRHEKLRDLQTFYVSAYMKILLALRSQSNNLHNEGFMSDDFIQYFCYEIISRFSELVVTDINMDSLYNTLYLEYSISDTIVFDIDNERFGLRQLFEVISQREVLMGSCVCTYEMEMLRRYYNLICNGSIERGNVKNDKKLPVQKFVQRVLQKRQLLEKKRKDTCDAHRKKQENKQRWKSQGQGHQEKQSKQIWGQQHQQKELNKNSTQSRQRSNERLTTSTDNKSSNNNNNTKNLKLLKPPPQHHFNNTLQMIQNDAYALQFHPIQKLQYHPPQVIPFYFIKSEILRMLDNYLTYYPIKPLEGRRQFYEIFCCLVIMIDNERFLMDVYANVLYRVLSDNKGELVMKEYESLRMVRMLHCEKYQRNFKHSGLARQEIICIFEKLRKIEIKRNRQFNKSFSTPANINSSTGRQKASRIDPSQQQQSSKVYKQYFHQLFNSPQLKEVVSYGQQLFSIKKFKQAIFVLEIAREKMNDKMQLMNEQIIGGCKGQSQQQRQRQFAQRRNMERMMVECDLLLSDCYTTLAKEFYSLHGYVNEKCIFDRMEDDPQFRNYLKKKRSYNHYKRHWFNKISIQQTTSTPNINQSPIPKLTQLITKHYTKIINTLQERITALVKNPYEDQTQMPQQTFRSVCFSAIYRYCVRGLAAISTKDDLKVFYKNLLLSGVMFKWYEEKFLQLMEKIVKRASDMCDPKMNNSTLREFFIDEFPNDKQPQQKQPFSDPKLCYPQTYAEILPSFYHNIKSKRDKFLLINMVNKVEMFNHVHNFQTIRALNQSLLETKQTHSFFDYLERYYNGVDKYEDMGLLDLQLLQKYHFEKENYHHVKAITKHMNKQYENNTYGEMEKDFPNWPQVYGYDLIAKIYDLNSKENPERYWFDFAEIIKQQKYLVVDGVKFDFEQKLQNGQLIRNIEKNAPEIFFKLSNELDVRIKQYFNLLRIIFSKLQLSKGERSLTIFQIMYEIYNRFFIQSLTKDEVHIDFFLYYLRFLCEKVNTKYFFIRKDDKIYKRSEMIGFLLRCQQYVKHHTLYMLRSLDPEPNTEKNSILRDILIPILVNNPVENLWTLTYLKYYEKKMPQGKQMIKRSQEKKQKFGDKKKDKDAGEVIEKYFFPEDSQINQLNNAAIHEVYRAVSAKIDSTAYSELVLIPITFIQWLQKTVIQKIDDPNKPGEMLYFAKQQNIQKQKEEVNKRIRSSKFRIPYPFDHRLYIKSVSDIKLSIYEGKSMPCFVSFICGMYSDIQGDKYRKSTNTSSQSQNNNAPNNFNVEKHILLKNNFTHSDHRIETNTANFYKQIGLLDEDTTYGILNLTKYILIIEKICTPHKSLRDLVAESCDINYDEVNTIRNKHLMELRKKYGNEKYLIQPKWVDSSQELRRGKDKISSKASIFNHFYHKAIQNYKNINQWWSYMQNYVRTLAYWSYMCFVTKLGDRHLTNILVSDQGKFIHIDYEYNFGYGLLLPYPEWMPFRLTEIMMSPLGTFKEKGLFFAYFVEIAKIFNPNQERIWKALCHFSPIQRSIIEDTSRFNTVTTVNTIEEKCQKVINLSKDNSLLRLMFSGWNPDF